MMDAIIERCFEMAGEIYHSVFVFETELTETQKCVPKQSSRSYMQYWET
jgi:hypothetical protein